MTKSANIETIEKTTGKPWEEWLDYFQSIGAKNLSHKDIAGHVHKELEGTLDNAGWWAQGVTVAYEQHIGRRQPGQRSNGTFEVAVSKTIGKPMDDVMARWIELIHTKTELNDVRITKPPTTSTAEKSRHWGCGLEDGTRVNADTYPKSPEKTIFTITHIRLESHEAAEKWRTYWKTIIEEV